MSPQTISVIFAKDVTRNIAPVVYFHEQAPQKVAEEVSEYIITGGYGKSDPRRQHIQSTGIHDQFVRLLKGIASELKKPGGSELPASWVSGFYGSGKSSFAKLLGLALDGLVLPDGQTLADALLARDTTPKAGEFREAWEHLLTQIDPIAVVFDVGAAARDSEQIHGVVKREVQQRLGYCPNHHVADYELKLEQDGQWQAFLTAAADVLGKPWDTAKTSPWADEDFSQVLHHMNPERFVDPLSWYESRAGSQTGIGTSVAETSRDIAAMLKLRSPGKTLFIVVDEVSQYIYQDTKRMLALQSFVSDLGQKLKGQVWLIATGQQKLEDSDDESNIGKLKDRFPPKLRVHLAPTNIRDVVHKRLLQKAQKCEPELRRLFQQHRADLKLYAYECESITEEDFVEVYPMLPGYIDLLMQITSNLRTRSTQARSDDHAVRGLLQLLGELFREQKLGDRPLGSLITLVDMYEVQQSALENDVQLTLTRLFNQEQVIGDSMAIRVAKVVSLLETIQEEQPTTPALVSQCLYDRLGVDGASQLKAVTKALEKLRNLNLLSYSEKTGYKIQSSAGQDWARERDNYSVISSAISQVVADQLKTLLGSVDNPRFRGHKFRWTAYYSDARQQKESRLQSSTDLDSIAVDFRFLSNQSDREASQWIRASHEGDLRNRLLWVVGDRSLDHLTNQVREFVKSREMYERYQPRRSNLPQIKQRLLSDEQNRKESLERSVKEAISQAFVDGELYFRGRHLDKQSLGSGFTSLLLTAAEEILPELYNLYANIAIQPSELKQLLEPTLSGPSSKFMTDRDGLGILELDGGKYMPTCQGEVPRRIANYIQDRNGSAGSELLSHFGGPPYGHPADMVKACVAGLLRAGQVRIRPESGPEITSVRDPGAKDLFDRDRDFKRADILPPSDTGIKTKDLIAICRFFKDFLQIEVDRENDAIADAVFQQFPQQRERLRDLEARYNRLPDRRELPQSLIQFRDALEKSMRSRQVEETVKAVHRHLDRLRDGVQQLGTTLADFSEEAVILLERAQNMQHNHIKQLEEVKKHTAVQPAITALYDRLNQERPWRDVASLEVHLKAIEDHYQEVRSELIERQDRGLDRARRKLQKRDGAAQLPEQKFDEVVKIVEQVVYGTTADALYPSLLQLKNTVQNDLKTAEKQADAYLDRLISETTGEQVIELPLELAGMEVKTEEDVEALVSRLRERLLAQLKEKGDVKIRLV